MKSSIPAFADPEAKAILAEICERHGVPVELLRELAERVAGHTGAGRAHGVMGDVEDVISPYLDVNQSEGRQSVPVRS
jgi:hypothetical protein